VSDVDLWRPELALATLTILAVLGTLPAVIVLHRDARRAWWALAHSPDGNGRRAVARAALRSSRYRIAAVVLASAKAGMLLPILVPAQDVSPRVLVFVVLLTIAKVLAAVDGWLAARDRREILRVHHDPDR
jgi:hypothetical protein